MRLHVVTAITRPENLPLIAETLAIACQHARCDVVWHWQHDFARAHVGGQKPKNDALDAIHDGWVWFLDDDTVASQHIPALVVEAEERGVDAVVVSQSRADGRVLHAAPEYARVGYIDIGQAVIRREAIGEARIPEHYDGDGMFLEPLLAGLRVWWVPGVSSYHNALAA